MLYHKDVYLPEPIKNLDVTIPLRYSHHAKKMARHRNAKLPEVLRTGKAELIEVETNLNDEVVKVVYRQPHCKEQDICLVVIPERGFVKTVWLNRKTDTHRTLDTSRYVKEEEA